MTNLYLYYVLGFVCAIHSVASGYRNFWIDVTPASSVKEDSDGSTNNSTENTFWQFSNYEKTFISIIWSLFDIFQYDVSSPYPFKFFFEVHTQSEFKLQS